MSFAVVFRMNRSDVVVDRAPDDIYALLGRHTYLGEKKEDETLSKVIRKFTQYGVEFGNTVVWFSYHDWVLPECLPMGALYDFIRCRDSNLDKCILPFEITVHVTTSQKEESNEVEGRASSVSGSFLVASAKKQAHWLIDPVNAQTLSCSVSADTYTYDHLWDFSEQEAEEKALGNVKKKFCPKRMPVRLLLPQKEGVSLVQPSVEPQDTLTHIFSKLTFDLACDISELKVVVQGIVIPRKWLSTVPVVEFYKHVFCHHDFWMYVSLCHH